MSRYVSVPLTRYSENREDILLQLSRLGAHRVFLCTDRGLSGDEARQQQLRLIKDGVNFFRANGYSVGIWLSSLGHGGNLVGAKGDGNPVDFAHIVGITGETAQDSFCPLDSGFLQSFCSWVALLASSGADMIMLDDDFRLSNRPGGFGCFCEKHLELLSEKVGESVCLDGLLSKIYGGGANKYRDACFSVMGDSLRLFASELRRTVDLVNPKMRLGACACLSVWDADGVDSIELAHILAGGTRPFMRFIGAPYWARTSSAFGVFAGKLAYIVELERMQAHWCEGLDIETMSEGDVYPRPRFNVPSAYLEGFDTALLADGRADGILKYAIDYSSSPLYEQGYAKRAENNKELYALIEQHFSAKRDVGIKAACEMKKLRHKHFSGKLLSPGRYSDNSFVQPEQAFLCDNSLPITYGDSEICVCFGENAKYINPTDFRGMIVDIPAALILQARGIDAGLISANKLSGVSGEHFPAENERTALSDSDGLYDAEIKSNARVLSFYESANSSPSAYIYENSDGMRFYVICADMDSSRHNSALRRSYSRQRQLISACEWLSGASLPAACPGNPDLYIMCKASESSLAVGLWNFFEDSIPDAVITLGKKYSKAEFVNCNGVLSGDTVRLNTEIAAFGFAGIELFD